MRYKFLDLAEVNAPYAEAIKRRIADIVDRGIYIGGPEVSGFESALARMHGMAEGSVAGVSNGLDALRLIFRAYIELGKLHEGDEVIVPSNTYVASVLAVTDSGLHPVFAEPDPATYNLDTASLHKYLTPRTRAIMPVHLYGRVCWDKRLLEFATANGLIVVEDNAQAIGALSATEGVNGLRLTGTLGHAAAFSFYPTKNLGALGDAGAVMTADRELSEAVRALRNYGSDRRYHNIYAGLNCRMDPVQAAVLSVKLPFLEDGNRRRNRIAAVYEREINHPMIAKPLFCSDGSCVWHQYVIRCPERDRLRDYLAEKGVATDIHYPLPPHRQPCYKEFSSLQLPIAETLAAEVLSLPVSASTSEADAYEISEIISRF